MKPGRWNDVIDGPEERAFFIGKEGTGGLARSGSDFLSAEELAHSAGLSEERVRELIAKFTARGLIVESPSNPGHFGYWHRVIAGSDTFRLRRSKHGSKRA
jgi:hypothetical protein